MAAVVVTDTAVIPQAGAKIAVARFGETLTAGLPVYLKAADDSLYKADNNTADPAPEASVVGITCAGGVAGQYGGYVTEGPLSFGAVLTKGKDYYAGQTPGEIVPEADLVTGNNKSRLGTATSTSVLDVKIKNKIVKL